MNYETLLRDLVAQDERFVVLSAENRASIRGLPQHIGSRFIDVGIAEQTMIGAAAGLALRGRIPVVHALAAFLTMRSYEFIRTDVGIGRLPVKMVGAVPGFLSEANGPTHQAIEDIALMRSIPPVQIFCPADEEDMLIGLPDVLKSPSPFYIRYNNLKPVVSHDPHFAIGSAELVTDGSDITILVYGMLFAQAYTAAKLLEQDGLSVRLVNMRTVKPIDEKILLASAKTSLIVTVEDHFLTGGLFSIVAEVFLKHRMHAPRVVPMALDHHWFKAALLPDVLEYEGFSGEKMAEKILEEYENQSVKVLLQNAAIG
jgi:transketolase